MADVRTIPAHAPFLDSLVAHVLSWERDRLADALVLLPSRRACLAAREAFVRLGGGAMLLPRLLPIGEPDEAELMLDPTVELDLPPAIAPLRRRLLLTELVLRRGSMTHEQAVRLAGELERFVDEAHNEEVELGSLADLAPIELAAHWEEVLRFLKILAEHWPRVLADEGRLDPARRRRLLVDGVTARWRNAPPPHPVVAAGITGTIPCIARLLAQVARQPDGCIVVPALDQALDEAGWTSVGPSHPQWGLKRLLEVIAVDRAAVRPWPLADGDPGPAARARLWREVLRPAETTEAWRREVAVEPAAVTGLELAEAPELAAEALQIALRLREALETPGRRAMLVTPNRFLGRRVAAELLRWGVMVDDSAGVPLDQSPPGTFLLLTAHLLAEAAPPVPLLAALKHPLSSGGIGQREFRRHVRALERGLLRGPRTTGGLPGLLEALRRRDPEGRWPAPVPPDALAAWLEHLVAAAAPMLALTARPMASLIELLEAHLAFAEWLAADAEGSPAELWAREAGACAHQFVSDLRLTGEITGEVPTSAYPALLAVLMGTHAVRAQAPGHARVAILGQLESRLVAADLVILGGLNEDASPPAVESGPWLNRAMRRQLGLPPVEQAIGFAAHDFLMTACAPEVVLSRALKDERGAPTTPSRWLSRLLVVLAGSGARERLKPADDWGRWAAALDAPAGPARPWPRPEPRPPAHARPKELWATDVERLMRDPYAVYARHILKLQPLEPLDADPGGAERGQIIHRALEEFVRAHPERLPDEPLRLLLAIGARLFARQAHRPQVTAVWWPRFERIAAWFCVQEGTRRANVVRVATELRGSLELGGGGFTIRARADRVEVGADGSLVLVDYKTGGVPKKGEVARGLSPQLTIEALIAEAGGFPGVAAGPSAAILYWQLQGGDPAAGAEHDPVGGDGDLRQFLGHAQEGLARLLAHFADAATPYVPIPRPEIAPAFSDYEHLSRRGEWWGTEVPS